MKVTFVCTGNTCRSPMIALMFAQYSRLRANNIDVDSAGTMQHTRPMAALTRQLLINGGIKVEKDFVSKYCDADIFNASDIIFVMGEEQERILKREYGESDKIVSLAVFNSGEEIPDPYGLGEGAYWQVYTIFEGMLEKLYEFVEKKKQ